MLVPRILVTVDASVASFGSATKRPQEGPTLRSPNATGGARRAGPAFRKELFVEAMLENSPTKPPRRTRNFVVSATVQAIFLAALVLLPLYFTEAIDMRQFNETLLLSPSLLPAPPPLSVAVAPSVAPKRRVLSVVGKLVAPRVIPNQVARPSEEPSGNDPLAETTQAMGIPRGVLGGQAGGVLGGVLSGTSPSFVPPSPIDSAPRGPLRVGGAVKVPRLIFRTEPIYPVLARQAKVKGEVVIDAVIDAQGNVVEMHPVSGSPLLIPAATEALRHWKYEPTIVSGQAFPVQLLVTITFQLS